MARYRVEQLEANLAAVPGSHGPVASQDGERLRGEMSRRL